MTADFMGDWVKSVWERCPGALHNAPSMLVLYTFHRLLSEELQVKPEDLCDDCPEVVTSEINEESASVPVYSEAVKSFKTLWQFLCYRCSRRVMSVWETDKFVNGMAEKGTKLRTHTSRNSTIIHTWN
jgi:hypothetical protein